MRFFGIIALVILLFAVAVPVAANGGFVAGGIGVSTEKPQMPPTIWISLTAVIRGEEVAALSTDTPMSVVGPRHPDVVYRLRVQAVNLPHLEWVKMYLNENPSLTRVADGFFVCDLESLGFRPGANLLKVQLHGRFGTKSINLVLFRPKWRTSEEVMGAVTVYMTDTDSPINVLASRGWVPIRDFAPAPAPDFTGPVVAPTPPPPPPPAAAALPVLPEVGPAALATPGPVRFFVDGIVEVSGWVSTQPGERLVLVAKTAAGQISYEIAGGGKVASATMATPGITIFRVVVPAGDTVLSIRIGQDAGQLIIKGVS